MSSQSLREKSDFFKALDALDHAGADDDQVDEAEEAHRDKCRAFFASGKKLKSSSTRGVSKERASQKAPPPPRRTPSAPVPPATASQVGIIRGTPVAQKLAVAALNRALATADRSFIAETPVPDSARPTHASLLRRATLPLASKSSELHQSPSTSSALRKRKRQSLVTEIPEAEKVLRALSFFYIPNDDIAPPRKLRIAKAQEYGARWVRTLSDASHVIVEKRLTYKDIENILNSAPVVTSSLVLVNEDYPIDCITFRTLLNPSQSRYSVYGCPTPASESSSNLTSGQARLDPVSPSHDHSLQLKQQKPKSTLSYGTGKNTSPQSAQSTSQDGAREGRDSSKRQLTIEPYGSGTTANVQDTLQNQPAQPAQTRPSSPDQVGDGPAAGDSSHFHITSYPKDELSSYIELMQKYKDLPLDVEEDDDMQSVADGQNETSDSDVEEASEDERSRKRQAVKSNQKDTTFADRFACNRGGTLDKSSEVQNPNARTIEVLQSMCDYYTRINDTWRTFAYRKAIATLRRQSVKITTEDEAYRLPNIGRRLATKIEEIVSTNRLRRLEYAHDEPLDQVLETFLKIYGVGTSRANKWIAKGFRTLQDLKDKATLTTNQRIGIDHYDDLNTRIPRSEVAALGQYVKAEAYKLEPAVELLIGGSYRRGAPSSGDVDIVITKKDTSSASDLAPFLEDLIRALTQKGFLVATLAALHSHRTGKDGPGSKWHGCCVLPPPTPTPAVGSSNPPPQPQPIWRRIDFLLVPESEYGAALIYFTGNDIFNRSLRLLASKKGMRLNQRGLYKEVLRGRARAKVTEGELLEGRDERRIFEILGVQWREPSERWC